LKVIFSTFSTTRYVECFTYDQRSGVTYYTIL